LNSRTSAPPSGAPITEASEDVAPTTPIVRPRSDGGAVSATAISTLTNAKR
jgi:hypothetical protein